MDIQDTHDCDWDGEGIAAALKAIGASLDPNDWVMHHIQHNLDFNMAPDSQIYQVGDKTYRATGARFQAAINVNDSIVT